MYSGDSSNMRELWLKSEQVPDNLKEELRNINDIKDIEDRFYCDLVFGTGGLRGKIGAGTNRMNILTVGKATQGLANYLLKYERMPSVCIAYDTRHMSLEFAKRTASILCGNNINTYLFDTVHPTPMLSFAVRYMNASAGVVITASHNPKEYNGYKVYGSDGQQITDDISKEVLSHINDCDIFSNICSISLDEASDKGLLHIIGKDVDTSYFENVKALVMRKGLISENADTFKIIYSPLHGSGNIPIRRILRELGFSVQVVKEQELPDGNFPTTKSPNPEDPSVFELAIAQAEKDDPDLIFATDPDCDRIGVLSKKENGEFSILTGNQVGALLCDYIIRTHQQNATMPPRPAVLKTIVTSDFVKRICEPLGVAVVDTLTGFKYIGEMAEQWMSTKKHSFLFGFEESYGYLAGDFVRDKDAVIAATLIAEMALYHKTCGKTLVQALNELFRSYGYYLEKLISIDLPGKDGREKINKIISGLRENYKTFFSNKDVAIMEDYKHSKRIFCFDAKEDILKLPASNVLKFIFQDESWIVLRPSGTEPKIKIYLSVSSMDKDQAEVKLNMLQDLICDVCINI